MIASFLRILKPSQKHSLNLLTTKEPEQKALPYQWQFHSLILQIQSFSKKLLNSIDLY